MRKVAKTFAKHTRKLCEKKVMMMKGKVEDDDRK